jgi:hypothetical protein
MKTTSSLTAIALAAALAEPAAAQTVLKFGEITKHLWPLMAATFTVVLLITCIP